VPDVENRVAGIDYETTFGSIDSRLVKRDGRLAGRRL